MAIHLELSCPSSRTMLATSREDPGSGASSVKAARRSCRLAITTGVCLWVPGCPVSPVRAAAGGLDSIGGPVRKGPCSESDAEGGVPRLRSLVRARAQRLPTTGRQHGGLWAGAGAAPAGPPVLLRCRRVREADLRRADTGPDVPSWPLHGAAAEGPRGDRAHSGRPGRLQARRAPGSRDRPRCSDPPDPSPAGPAGRAGEGARRRRLRPARGPPLRHGPDRHRRPLPGRCPARTIRRRPRSLAHRASPVSR